MFQQEHTNSPTIPPYWDSTMAPSVVTIDNMADLDFSDTTQTTQNGNATGARTLLLAPPSVASHPSALTEVAEAYDRSQTDIQMLDRLSVGLVSLPASTYDVVLILSDVDRTRQESTKLLDRTVIQRIVESLKAGGRLKTQDGEFGTTQSAEQTEAILAGLVSGNGDGMVKPDNSAAVQTVKLSFGKKKKKNELEAANTGKRKMVNSSDNGAVQSMHSVKSTPAGVGFIENEDDWDSAEDEFPDEEELDRAGRIDPDTLLTEQDRQKPLNIRK